MRKLTIFLLIFALLLPSLCFGSGVVNTLLNAKTAVGVGDTVITPAKPYRTYTCQADATGAPTAVTVDIYGNAIGRTGNFSLVATYSMTGGDLTNKLAKGSTDTNVATTAFQYTINGLPYYKAAVAVGTAFTATTHDIAQDKWSSYLLSINAAGTIAITKAAADYTTEALAIAAAPPTPVDQYRIGYMTIQTATGYIFDATTDALQGGTGGHPAATTHYFGDMQGIFHVVDKPMNAMIGKLTTLTGGTSPAVTLKCLGVE